MINEDGVLELHSQMSLFCVDNNIVENEDKNCNEHIHIYLYIPTHDSVFDSILSTEMRVLVNFECHIFIIEILYCTCRFMY